MERDANRRPTATGSTTEPAPDVSDLLRDRRHEPSGLRQMTFVSLFVHAAALAVMIFTPTTWMAGAQAEPQTVMTISLGGGPPGPLDGGLTTGGGRAVQVPSDPEPPPRPEPQRPPAEATPQMVEPKPAARPQQKAVQQPVPVAHAPEDARGKTPSKGAEPSPGQALSEMGVRGQGFGLSSGGGGGAGLQLDVADFCCPDYLVLMTERIRTNWNARADAVGDAVIRFTILRDGTIQGVEVFKSSGYAALDINAQRALLLTRQLPALPAGFPNPTLTVRLTFNYQR